VATAAAEEIDRRPGPATLGAGSVTLVVCRDPDAIQQPGLSRVAGLSPGRWRRMAEPPLALPFAQPEDLADDAGARRVAAQERPDQESVSVLAANRRRTAAKRPTGCPN
jgi:hypothetical protein